MGLEWYWHLWLIFAAVLPLALIGFLIARLRSMKRYVLFRLVDGATNEPIAGVEVSGIKIGSSYAPSYATTVGGQAVYAVERQTTQKLVPLGRTNSEGVFRIVLGYTSYPALWLEHNNPALKGMVAVEHVSRQGGFPLKPFKCRVVFGMVQPPPDVLS